VFPNSVLTNGKIYGTVAREINKPRVQVRCWSKRYFESLAVIAGNYMMRMHSHIVPASILGTVDSEAMLGLQMHKMLSNSAICDDLKQRRSPITSDVKMQEWAWSSLVRIVPNSARCTAAGQCRRHSPRYCLQAIAASLPSALVRGSLLLHCCPVVHDAAVGFQDLRMSLNDLELM